MMTIIMVMVMELQIPTWTAVLGLAQVWDDESNIDDDDDDGDSASGTHRCLVMMRPTMLWMTSQLHWMFRTHRMLTWLGGGRAVARVRVPRPRPQLRHQVGKSSNLINKSSMHCRRLIFQQSPRYQPTAQAFRPNSVQVKFDWFKEDGLNNLHLYAS